MGEAVDTIPSILNKCLFVSPDGRTHGPTDAGSTPISTDNINSVSMYRRFQLSTNNIRNNYSVNLYRKFQSNL